MRPLTPNVQLNAVANKLKQVNPGFQGTLEHEAADGRVAKTLTSLDAEIKAETNLSSLAALSVEHLSGVTMSPFNERAAAVVAAMPRLKTINGALEPLELGRLRNENALLFFS